MSHTDMTVFTIAFAVLAIVYFIPTAVAVSRGHHQMPAIVAMNILLGWTLLGWIAALIWALTAVRQPVQVMYARPTPAAPVEYEEYKTPTSQWVTAIAIGALVIACLVVSAKFG